MKYRNFIKSGILSFLLLPLLLANANEVDIVAVKAEQSGNKTWSFAVTLKHADEGWDHYANEWQVLAPDTKVLATRTLYHPHEDEQPFTRGTSGVKIPKEVKFVYVIAKDTVHGLSKKAVKVDLASSEIKALTLDELRKKKTP